MIRRFVIYSPTLGMRQDWPGILLQKALLPDAQFVQTKWGEVQKAKMRTKELVRTIHPISSIDTSNNTISISGNVTAHYGNGASVVIYDTDNNYQQLTLSTTSTYNTTSTILTVTTSLTISSPTDFVFNAVDVGSVDPASADFLKAAFPDGNSALLYKTLTLSDGTERLMGFTSNHVYYWDTTLTKWQSIFTCSAECTFWDADKYGDNMCMTNNVDRPQYWDGNTANTCENIDTRYTSSSATYIAKAKFIKSYHNYLFLGNVELANGTKYQHYVYTSSILQGLADGGWIQGAGYDAGAYYVGGEGEISGGFGLWQDYLVIFKRRSIRKFWFVGLAIPFQQSELSPEIGCITPGSVVNDWNGDLYYYGTDKAIHGIAAGNVSGAVDKTCRDIEPSLVEGVRSIAVDEYKELRWAIPYGNSATANNKIIVYRPGERRWDTDMDVAVTAFGTYTRQSNVTWDTLPYSSWDEWGWDSWDAIAASSDFPVDICGDADGYTYALHGGYQDDGSDYTSYFVLSTDMADKQALPFHKRVTQVFIYVQKESTGTLSLSVKRDNETGWQSLGSVSLSGNEDILRQRLSVDFSGRHFLLKVSGTNAFRVIGLEFELQEAGQR